jgi:hypothetical protein
MSSDSFDRAATRLGTAKRHWVTMTTNERGLVIVTGASSRIGEAIALHLGEGGFSVLAGSTSRQRQLFVRDARG